MSLIENSLLIVKPQVGGWTGFKEKIVTEKDAWLLLRW